MTVQDLIARGGALVQQVEYLRGQLEKEARVRAKTERAYLAQIHGRHRAEQARWQAEARAEAAERKVRELEALLRVADARAERGRAA